MSDNAMSRRVERKGPGKWSRWYGSPRYIRGQWRRDIGTIARHDGQFIFLFDKDAARVDIHPIENIHSISFKAPDVD